MALSCPRCEQEPAADARPGSRCAGCGAELVVDLADEERGGAAELDIDPAWRREKAEKAAQAAAARPRKPRMLAGTIVVLLIAAFLAVGVVVLVKRDHPRSPADMRGVSIYIRAVGTYDVFIDGRLAGKTPLVYTSPKSKKPILIEVRQLGAVRQIVPDHDQDVFVPGP